MGGDNLPRGKVSPPLNPHACSFWTNRTSPSKREGLGSPLAACSIYGDLTCSVHAVNNFHCFVIIKRMYAFVSEDHMLDWQLCQICYLLEIKLLLTDLGGGGINKAGGEK